MLEFWKNEWKLFLEDLSGIKNMFSKFFGGKPEYLLLDSSEDTNVDVNNNADELNNENASRAKC